MRVYAILKLKIYERENVMYFQCEKERFPNSRLVHGYWTRWSTNLNDATVFHDLSVLESMGFNDSVEFIQMGEWNDR